MKRLFSLFVLLSSLVTNAASLTRTAALQAPRTPAAPSDPTNGLVLHWKFDEQSGGTVADSSGNGRTGALANGVSWGGASPHGAYVTFHGTTDVITASSIAWNASGDDAVTISCWVKPAATSSSIRAIWRPANASITDFAVYHWNDNSFRHYVNGVDPAMTSVTAGLWYHVLVRQPATTGNSELWVNGSLIGTSNGRRAMTTANLYVGADEFTAFNPSFNGDMANIRIYGRALTTNEIAVLAAQ